MPRYPRTTEPRPSKPRTKRVPAMSVRPLVAVETRPSQIQPESSSSGGTGWSENAWEDTPTIATKPPRGPKIVQYCNKPGQFWPDGQEPPFKGQKHRRRVFVTKGRRQPREEITNNLKEINRLKEDVRPTQSFTPRTGDILVYHDYSDYEGSDEDDFFESLDDDEESTHTPLAPLPPPTRTSTPDPPTTAPIPDEASLPSIMVAPPPPLPPFTTTAAPPRPISTPSHSLPAGLTAGVDDIKERQQEMIRKYKAKADARAAEAARLKKDKDALEQHIEVNAKEDERSKVLHTAEMERQRQLERQREMERKREMERQEELQRQEERERLERERLEEIEQQKKREHLVAIQPAQAVHVVPTDTMDVDIENSEVGAGTKVRNPSPRRTRVPPVAHRPQRSISPRRQGSSSRRPPSPTRPSTYRDYVPSRFERHPPARRRYSPDRFTRRPRSPSPRPFARRPRSPSPRPFARRGRSSSPMGDRAQASRYNRLLESGHSANVATPPPTIVPAAHPSIPGTLALPMGFLQFRPSSTVTTVAGFNRMGSRPVENHTARFILARMSHLSQNDDANPLSSSLKSNPHNRLLNIASYPPYHLLHVISRGRLVVSKKSEIRLRLWRAQHPSAPLWFFAIRCLSRGLDWRVFANPQHLVGPLQSISGPRPAYLDHTPPLLTRGYGEFDLYQDSVRDMLRLPFARRFCTMGGLVWRLAMQYGPDNLFSAALSGPSSDAYMHSHSDTIGTDIDDKVMDSHLKLLLGVTVDGQSLWPPIDVFENHMQWEGEWTASLETWFIKHCAMIQSRDTRAFATHSQWSSRLWQHSTTSSRDATRLLTEARAQLLCYDIDQMDPKSFAALD